MIKRIFTVFLAFVVAYAAFGCRGGGTSTSSSDSQSGGTNGSGEKTAQKTLNETVSALRKDEFAVSSLTDDGFYGLNDESVVGVNETDYTGEVKYPIPSNEDFDGEVIKWNEYEFDGDNFFKLKSVLNYAAQKNAAGVKVKLDMPENEVIDIDTTYSDHIHFAIWQKGLNGFYLQGNNCTFNLKYRDFDWRGFIYFEKCDDLWIENVRIDYAVPNIVYGTIEEYDTKKYTVTVALNKECNEFTERLIGKQATICSYLEFGKATKIPKMGGNYFVDSTFDGSNGVFEGYDITGDAQNGYKITIKISETQKSQFHTVAKGDLANIAFSYYVYNVLTFDGCGTSRLEHVTIYYSPAMGIVGTGSENILINGLKIALPENSARLMTCCADAIHIYQQRGKIEITNGLTEYSHDDAVNVKSGYFYSLGGYDIKNHTLTIAKDTQPIDAPVAGDVIAVYDRDSFGFKGEFTVVECSGSSVAYTIKVKESLAAAGIGEWKDCVVTNTACAEFVFKNNIVRNKRNRGVLCMARNARIENNAFKNVAHGAICNISFIDRFNEATVPHGTVIKNNKLIGNNYELSPQGDILVSCMTATGFPKTGVIKGVVIENNFITGGGAAGVALIGTKDCRIKNNLLFNVCKRFRDDECQILLYNSFGAEITGNYAYSDSSTILGAYAKGSTDVSTVTETDNYGCAVETGAFTKKRVGIKRLDKNAVTIDGVVSEWTDMGRDIEIVGASYADEILAKPEDYADRFGIKLAKIGYTDDGIYFAFSVKDDELAFEQIENFWFGDCVEVIATAFKDYPEEDLASYKNRKSSIQAIFAPSWTATDGWRLHADRTTNSIFAAADKISAKCVYTSDGYSGEAFIPFGVCPDFKAAYESGDYITFNVVFADAQRDGTVRLQAGNVPHLVETYKKQTSKSVEYVFEK